MMTMMMITVTTTLRLSFQTATLRAKMYFGWGEYVEAPKYPWQSKAWISSIRVCSGHFARNTVKKVIVPGETVTSARGGAILQGRVLMVDADNHNYC